MLGGPRRDEQRGAGRCCCDLVQESGSRRGARTATVSPGMRRTSATSRRAPEHAAHHIPGHCPRTARLVRAAERGEESAPLSQVRLGPGWVARAAAQHAGKSCVGSWAGAARTADIRIGSGDKLAGCPYKAIVLS